LGLKKSYRKDAKVITFDPFGLAWGQGLHFTKELGVFALIGALALSLKADSFSSDL
jgi:hypothetical protein